MKEGQKLIKMEIIIDSDLSNSGVKDIGDVPSRIFDILKCSGFIAKDVSCHEAKVYRQHGLGISASANGHSTTEKNWSGEESDMEDME